MVEPPQLNTTLFTIYVGILRNIYIIVSKYQVGILEVNLPIVSTNCALVFIMEQSQSTQIWFLLDEIKLNDAFRRKRTAPQLL